MANYRILSIDGGGVRGILTCVVLERLAEAVPDFLTKLDLFAGTSTGSVLALGRYLHLLCRTACPQLDTRCAPSIPTRYWNVSWQSNLGT